MTNAAEVRTAIAAEMQNRSRGWLARVETLTWDLDRLTAAAAVNERRAAMGLAPWVDGHAIREG